MLCKELGIDDPAFWMDTVSAKVIDQWLAWHIVDSERMSKRPGQNMVDPQTALNQLQNRMK